VLHLDGAEGPIRKVTNYEEKPESSYMVSMGIYALSPAAVEHVPAGRFDIPDLVLALLEAGLPVGAFPFEGYWLDIGRHDDYERAQADYDTIVPQLLGETE
jgi:NDP-sugar pyrophosphorylase family protein